MEDKTDKKKKSIFQYESKKNIDASDDLTREDSVGQSNSDVASQRLTGKAKYDSFTNHNNGDQSINDFQNAEQIQNGQNIQQNIPKKQNISTTQEVKNQQNQESMKKPQNSSSIQNTQASYAQKKDDNLLSIDEYERIADEKAKKYASKNQKRGIGCGCSFLPRLSCRSIACLGCITPILLILISIIIIVFQPDSIWNPVKGVLNNNLNTENYVNIKEVADSDEMKDFSFTNKLNMQIQNSQNLDETQNNLESQDTNLQNTDQVDDFNSQITISEKELAFLLKDRFLSPENIYLDIKENKIQLMADIDDKGEPLWIYIDIEKQNNQFVLSKSGFGLFCFPQSMIEGVQNTMSKGLDIINIKDQGEVFQKLTSTNEDIKIESIEIQNDQLLIKYEK